MKAFHVPLQKKKNMSKIEISFFLNKNQEGDLSVTT